MKYSNRILIVDDDPASGMLMKELLQPHFSDVVSVESGIEAIAHCKKGNIFDLVFMDLLMRDMDGLSATKAIKKINPHLPIVAHSAVLNHDTKTKCSEAGINTFLAKPIKQRELENIIREFLHVDLKLY